MVNNETFAKLEHDHYRLLNILEMSPYHDDKVTSDDVIRELTYGKTTQTYMMKTREGEERLVRLKGLPRQHINQLNDALKECGYFDDADKPWTVDVISEIHIGKFATSAKWQLYRIYNPSVKNDISAYYQMDSFMNVLRGYNLDVDYNPVKPKYLSFDAITHALIELSGTADAEVMSSFKWHGDLIISLRTMDNVSMFRWPVRDALKGNLTADTTIPALFRTIRYRVVEHINRLRIAHKMTDADIALGFIRHSKSGDELAARCVLTQKVNTWESSIVTSLDEYQLSVFLNSLNTDGTVPSEASELKAVRKVLCKKLTELELPVERRGEIEIATLSDIAISTIESAILKLGDKAYV